MRALKIGITAFVCLLSGSFAQARLIDRDLGFQCEFENVKCTAEGELHIHQNAGAELEVSCERKGDDLTISDNVAGLSQVGTVVTFTAEEGSAIAKLEVAGLGADFATGEFISRLTIGTGAAAEGSCLFFQLTR